MQILELFSHSFSHSAVTVFIVLHPQGDNKEQCSNSSSVGGESERTRNTINRLNMKPGDSPTRLLDQEKEMQILDKPSPKTESEVSTPLSCSYSHGFVLLTLTISFSCF